MLIAFFWYNFSEVIDLDYNKEIGNRIRQRRKELGLSVDELADRINKNRATIYRYENGEVDKLPIDVFEPLARELDTSPAFLLGWNNTKDKEFLNKISSLHLSDEEKDKILEYIQFLISKKTDV